MTIFFRCFGGKTAKTIVSSALPQAKKAVAVATVYVVEH
jgi:hypothetical protein